MRRWCLVAALSLIAGTALAQDGLRSPALPERTPNSPPPPAPVDLFRVPPDFYNRQTPPPRPGVFVGGYWPWQDSSTEGRRIERRERRERRDERQLLEELRRRLEAPQPAAPAVAPLPPPIPGKPKTIYVIPGCYAGDRRPDMTRLPRECRASQLRVIPPT